MPEAWLIVGLGNPGPQYADTRHNIGHMVVDELAARRGEHLKAHKAGAHVAQTWLRPGGPRLLLAELDCFMNVSGGPTSRLASFYGVDPAHLVVVHDELDIPFDTVKLKVGGGHGGHNGVRDIAKALGTPDFARVRVGIGRPPGRQDAADWVLGRFTATERKTLDVLLGDAADAVEMLIDDGLVAAQRRYHAPRP